jgi:SAM-dependent methyltransferase
MQMFTLQLLSGLTATLTTVMIDVGVRAGALDGLAAGAATSAELAERTGLSERHVREWLGAMATSGIVSYDAATKRFTLPPEHAMCLLGDAPSNIAPLAQSATFLARFAPAVARTLEEGGGIPYADYEPDLTSLQDQMGRRAYDAVLIGGYVGSVAGLSERLEAGATAADIGCGSGHVVNLLARAFPLSQFVGYDSSTRAIDAARREAKEFGLTNARFEVRDVTNLPHDAHFDVITAFDAIHDQVQPRTVLREVRRVLADDGVFVMVDMNASSNLEDNIGNPVATYFYAVSLLHCMQVSLAAGGEGLGTAWGRQLATDLLREAGFRSVRLIDTPPEDPVNIIFEARP